MKTVSLLSLLVGAFCLVSCTKDFDIQNPDVDAFVKMIKQGSYQTKTGTSELPAFTVSDVPQLLKYVDDMTEVTFFPANPFSSYYGSPHILGEKILWIVQGVCSGTRYASLGGYIAHKETFERISTEELKALLTEYKRVFSDYSPSSSHLSTYIDHTPYRWR